MTSTPGTAPRSCPAWAKRCPACCATCASPSRCHPRHIGRWCTGCWPAPTKRRWTCCCKAATCPTRSWPSNAPAGPPSQSDDTLCRTEIDWHYAMSFLRVGEVDQAADLMEEGLRDLRPLATEQVEAAALTGMYELLAALIAARGSDPGDVVGTVAAGLRHRPAGRRRPQRAAPVRPQQRRDLVGVPARRDARRRHRGQARRAGEPRPGQAHPNRRDHQGPVLRAAPGHVLGRRRPRLPLPRRPGPRPEGGPQGRADRAPAHPQQPAGPRSRQPPARAPAAKPTSSNSASAWAYEAKTRPSTSRSCIAETCCRLEEEDLVLTFIDTDNYTPACPEPGPFCRRGAVG